MPICPKCKKQYTEGVLQCAECLIDLFVEFEESHELADTTNWVPLHPLPGLIYAEMVKEALEKKGIPCILRKDFLTSALGSKGTNDAGQQTYLFVPEEKLQESASVLHQMLDHI
ncbi:MAG: hypothetical protein ACE5HS_12240 [bacterium]